MRLLFVFVLATILPAAAYAEVRTCFDAIDEQNMRNAMGTGPDAIERAVKFFSELYGELPQSEKRIPDGILLRWIVPKQPGLATTFARYITINMAREPSASCTTTF
ncbi:hypothetical protein [Bradyrhizobium sp. LA6.12]|uniref:hypothetical protein n=1 Tax=unclassified Bradyrhizobium TaxID=2631580 RepID=UPI0033962807